MKIIYTSFLLVLQLILLTNLASAQISNQKDLGPSTLGLEKGSQVYSTSLLKLELLNTTQTVSALRVNDSELFDFTPGDRLKERDKNGFYHLGDINLGLRTGDNGKWDFYSSAKNRVDVEAIKPEKLGVLAMADLSRTFPADLPLKIIRYWETEGDNLVLRFELTNKTEKTVEIGALGIPMVFNNNFNNKSLEQAHAENVFFDPYIGEDAGYLQVIRLNGLGKVLLVVPTNNTPFENYRPLTDDPLRSGYTNEGLHEWMVHSKAFAETEWKGVEQWNESSSVILKPGESRSYGVKFLLANSVRDIENCLMKAKRPVVIGIPGYVLPMDVEAKLFVKYDKPVKSMTVEPAGALEFHEDKMTKNGWKQVMVKGKIWGRARLTIKYEDGLVQTVNYKVIAPEKELVASYGKFLTTEQWYENKDDLFGRSPSVITYNYEKKQQVTQDSRVWIAGLGDEGGNSWLGAIMKQLVLPNKEEVAKLEDFMNKTIWGGLQYSSGENKYGVRKSMFYYEPDSMPKGTYDPNVKYGVYGGFPSWCKKDAESVVRSYDYPHVAAAYWVMYRLSRYYKGLTSQQNWKWYLENAYHTTMAMIDKAPEYVPFGQMEGTVFILILNDLKAEGLNDLAAKLESAMKERVKNWYNLKYPFGSEMPWDSTGQEEVYMWTKYFGFDDKALVTLNAILAYMPTVPHWAYNGNARRYWDFLFAGNLSRFERMIHHYGSALNAIPVLSEYRDNPKDIYLLRVGYGGLMGSISNMTQDGFAPCAFHSFPSTLRNDAISGDYATGFLGYALNTATYIVHDEEFGWLSFGGNCSVKNGLVKTELTTAGRSRVYLAPVKLWLTLDAGQFKSVSYDFSTGEVQLELEKGNEFTTEACLGYKTVGKIGELKEYEAVSLQANEKGSFVIPLKDKVVLVKLRPMK
jgi:hypothetical protein